MKFENKVHRRDTQKVEKKETRKQKAILRITLSRRSKQVVEVAKKVEVEIVITVTYVPDLQPYQSETF